MENIKAGDDDEDNLVAQQVVKPFGKPIRIGPRDKIEPKPAEQADPLEESTTSNNPMLNPKEQFQKPQMTKPFVLRPSSRGENTGERKSFAPSPQPIKMETKIEPEKAAPVVIQPPPPKEMTKPFNIKSELLPKKELPVQPIRPQPPPPPVKKPEPPKTTPKNKPGNEEDEYGDDFENYDEDFENEDREEEKKAPTPKQAAPVAPSKPFGPIKGDKFQAAPPVQRKEEEDEEDERESPPPKKGKPAAKEWDDTYTEVSTNGRTQVFDHKAIITINERSGGAALSPEMEELQKERVAELKEFLQLEHDVYDTFLEIYPSSIEN